MLKNEQKEIFKEEVKEKYELPLNVQKFILQMSWAQHDSQWFLKSIREHGIENANQMNKKVISSVGKIEAKHILTALAVKKGSVKTIRDVFKIFNTIMDIVIPKVMKFKMIVKNDNEGIGIVNKCFIWKEVEKSKGEKQYECACNFRHRGWLDAMGVKGGITVIKRFSDGDDRCEFIFSLDKN